MLMKAIIIDDEPRNRELLHLMLSEHCPTVRVVGDAPSVTEGVRLVKSLKPDMVFLDIRMSRSDEGFEFFQHFNNTKVSFEVIFVTAREEFVLRAFNQTFAIGYLLKPVDPDELMNIVFKVKQKLMTQRSIEDLIDEAYPTNDVMYCYIKEETIRLRFTDGREKIARANTLDAYENQRGFIRANRQYVVNLAFVNKVSDVDTEGERMRGATAVLYNGEEISVAVSRKSYFLKQFELMSI
jgi:two-component system, LytTR family, response regulator